MSTDNKRRISKSRWVKQLAAATIITTFMATTACTIKVGDEPVTIEWPGMKDCISQMITIMDDSQPQQELGQTLSHLIDYCAQKLG